MRRKPRSMSWNSQPKWGTLDVNSWEISMMSSMNLA
jgi:hypothetical protein